MTDLEKLADSIAAVCVASIPGGCETAVAEALAMYMIQKDAGLRSTDQRVMALAASRFVEQLTAELRALWVLKHEAENWN